MKYHALKLTCPKCNLEADTKEVSIRADLNVLVEATCWTCGAEMFQELQLPELLINATQMDATENYRRVH